MPKIGGTRRGTVTSGIRTGKTSGARKRDGVEGSPTKKP